MIGNAPCPDAWCEIHGDRISRNLELALGLVPKGSRFCAVLKSDAYGHGIDNVVPLVRRQGITCVGIVSNAEARSVRQAGFDGTVIRLRAATPREIEDALPLRIQEQVGSLEVAAKLLALKDAGYPVRAHLALNADGMSRDGLEVSTVDGKEICLRIVNMLAGNIVGICTHFPSNMPADLRVSSALFQEQASWILDISRLERSDVLVHAGSSLTLVSDEPVKTDMYRCGAILYGILKPELGFQTTMDLKTRVISLGDYPKGATVGYDRDFRLDEDRTLACLAIGYANGLRRITQGTVAVRIGDRFAPVLGKIGMNTVAVDATDLKAVRVGDEATVFGGITDTRASLSKTEQQYQTIMADLYSDWGMRNQRIMR